jgi:hypothetical protein
VSGGRKGARKAARKRGIAVAEQLGARPLPVAVLVCLPLRGSIVAGAADYYAKDGLQMTEEDDFKARIDRLFERHDEGKGVAVNATKAIRERSEKCLVQFRDKAEEFILSTLRDAQAGRPTISVKYDDGSSGTPMARIEMGESSLEFMVDLTLCKVHVHRGVGRKPETIAFLPMDDIDKPLVEHYVEEFIALALRDRRLFRGK